MTNIKIRRNNCVDIKYLKYNYNDEDLYYVNKYQCVYQGIKVKRGLLDNKVID